MPRGSPKINGDDEPANLPLENTEPRQDMEVEMEMENEVKEDLCEEGENENERETKTVNKMITTNGRGLFVH